MSIEDFSRYDPILLTRVRLGFHFSNTNTASVGFGLGARMETLNSNPCQSRQALSSATVLSAAVMKETLLLGRHEEENLVISFIFAASPGEEEPCYQFLHTEALLKGGQSASMSPSPETRAKSKSPETPDRTLAFSGLLFCWEFFRVVKDFFKCFRFMC